MPNVLFVCSRNQWRSPTAEQVFRKWPGLTVRSAGTSPRARRTVGLDDLRWADVIIVMEPKHRRQLVARFPRPLQMRTVHVLDIPDDFRPMDPELVRLLEERVPPLLE